MTRIDRYIGITVLNAFLLVTVVIVGLDIIASVMDELKHIQGNYQILDVLIFVISRVPRRIYEYLSIIALVGCLVGLGSLAASSELTVMRSAGLSVGRLVWAVLKPTLVFALAGLLLTEYIVPSLEQHAQHRRSLLRAQDGANLLKTGYGGHWHREGNQFMRFRAVETSGVLHGVTIYYLDDKGAEVEQVLFADKGQYSDGSWQLDDVVSTRLLSGSSETQHVDSMPWQTKLTPDQLSIIVVPPKDMSISGLYYYTQYLQDQGLNADKYYLSFWKKILQPLGTIVLVMVGLSFVFGPLRSVTMGFRVFAGVLVGLVYRYTQDLLSPASIVFGFHPVVASVIPMLLCFAFSWYMLRKVG